MEMERIMNRISRVESNLANLEAGFYGMSITNLIGAAREAKEAKDIEKLNEIWSLIRNNYNAIEGAPKLSKAQPTLPSDLQTSWDGHKAKVVHPACLAVAKVTLTLNKQRGNTVEVNGKTIGKPFDTAELMAENMVAQIDRNMMERYAANIWDGTVKGIGKQTWPETSEENKEAEG